MINIKELLDKGYIRARAIINLVGKPKEHIEMTIQGVIDKLNTEPDVKLVESKIFETEEAENNMFSTFAEVDILAKDIEAIGDFCADYMPSSFEIEEPHDLHFQQSKLSSFINEFMTKIHSADMQAKQKNAENLVLAQTVRNVLKRSIMYVLKDGEKSVKDISDALFVVEEEIKTFIQTLEKEKIVKKSGDKYKLVK